MPKLKRSYSQKTLKTLFALSGNQCAHPECALPIVGPATEESSDIVIGEICHIYAVSEDGPRGKPGLTNNELNSPENLILLCPNHHTKADKPCTIAGKKYETHPAEKLIEWKQKHEAKSRKHLGDAGFDSFSRFQVLTELVDREIKEELKRLRESLFFAGTDYAVFWLEFGDKLATGKLAWGTDAVKSRALAWCARVLSLEYLKKAEEYLETAKKLETRDETRIAEAFIRSGKKDQKGALKILNGINSPMSRGAAFIILSKGKKGARKAVDWLNAAGTNITDMDPDGKYSLLENTLKLADWDKTREYIDELTDEDLREVPAFHYMKAMVCLLMAVPEEFRTALRMRPPFEEAEFRLASNTENIIRERREACKHFATVSEIAENLNCSGAAKLCEEYALWLELSDPETFDEGKRRLEARLRSPENALHLVRLAIHFRINLNLEVVEKEIERQKVLEGETICYDAARARTAIVFIKETPEDRANYIDQHEDEMARYSSRKSLRILKIKMFSQAGLLDRANENLDILKEEGLSDAEYGRIRDIIVEAGQSDQVEVAKKHFEKTNSPNDLIMLVNELGAQKRWNDVCEYGRVLFERTGAVVDAEKLADAMRNAQRNGQLVEFMRSNASMRVQSEKLQMLYCLALYSEGELLKVRSELKKLKGRGHNDEACRTLQRSIAISMGDWSDLSAIVAGEYSERKDRSAQDLIGAAEAAVRLNLPSAEELTTAAAEKGMDDSEVLTRAVFLASSASWKDDEKALKWLERAVSISGNNGPIRKIPLEDFKDLLEENSQWSQESSEIQQKLVRGDIPIFQAGQSLNKTLFELMLHPALENLSEKDPRRRTLIPAYSGTRLPMPVGTGGTVGIDATALITLSLLGLLDKALDAFDTVCVPHSTLAWLFEEKCRASFFHQPNPAKNAREVQKLLATKMIEEFVPRVVPDRELSCQIENDLSVLIAEAKNTEEDESQRIVVRSAPVYRSGSCMKEEADLSEHDQVMISCESVIRKLRQSGRITKEQEKNSYAYLRPSETVWPNEPEISDGAILYLDGLSVMNFLHLGVLGELKPAGFRPFVSQKTITAINYALSDETTYDKINDTIEQIRGALNSRIESEKIKVARQFNIDEPSDQSLYQHPTADMFALAGDCDAIIVDDKFVNQDTIKNILKTPVFSTLDVLETLLFSEFINQQKYLESRTLLRQSGYFFVPVSYDELKSHLGAPTIRNGKIAETLELKAVRENILHVQMNNWRQLPEEWFWLEECATAFTHVLNGLWTANADFSEARAYSDWIVGQINFPALIHALACKNGNDPYGAEFGKHIMVMLVSGQNEMPHQTREEYWKWLEDRILRPLKEQSPDSYSWIVEVFQEEIAKKTDMYLNMETSSMNIKSEGAEAVLARSVPPSLQDTLLDNLDFRKEYGLEERRFIFFGAFNVSILRSVALDAIRNFFSGAGREEATDMDGLKWNVQNDAEDGQLPSLVFTRGKNKCPVPAAFVLLSPDSETRLRFLEKTVSEFNFPSKSRKAWRKTLAKRPLENDEVEAFQQDFLDTSTSMEEFIRGKTEEPLIVLRSLVPSSHRYFHRLVGKYDGSPNIRDYAKNGIREVFRELSSWDPYRGFLSGLLLSSHSSMTAEIQVDNLDEDELVRAYDFLEKHGDPVSQLGAIEVGLRVFPSKPVIKPCLIRLIERIRDDNPDEKASSFNLLSTLFVFVNGKLSRTGILQSEPPFYRKLAAFSHAALIHRQLTDSKVDVDSFCKQLINDSLGEHYMQSFVDMRTDPCWNPIFSTAEAIKANFLDRIVRTAEKHEQNIANSELYDLVFGTENPSVYSVAYALFSYPPDPLEANEGRLQDLPSKIDAAIRKQVGERPVSGSSFTALANSAHVFRLGSDHVRAAAEALRSCGYRFPNPENGRGLTAILNGLATVAAVSRSRILADEVRIMVRSYRRDGRSLLSLDGEFSVCLAAVASRADLDEWTEFLGDWMTEIAFELKENEADGFRSALRYLCHIVPGLWVSCGGAYAAATALSQLRNQNTES